MGVIHFLLLSCLGLVMTAQAQDCSRPVGGDNMNLKGNDILLQTFPDGTKVTFACNVGYESAGGSAVITCTAGNWSPVRLRCQKKSCGSPGEVENGHVDYPDGNEFGSKAVVTCNEGYMLVGRPEISCGDKGWMGRLPTCEAATCDPPSTVDNGNFRPLKEVYEYGDVVHFSCQKDLTLSGSKSIECSSDGTFKPDPPTCIKVQCEDRDVPNADWIRGSRPPYGYQATVTYKCRSGYEMIGEPTAICQINSQWSPGLPQCKPVTCDPPPAVANGTFSPNKGLYEYPEAVSYSCDPGFKLTGSTSRQCSADKTFKPDPPTCTLVRCEDPVVPNADWIDGSQPPYGLHDRVTYKCKSGYEMIGEPTATCDINSQWSPRLPQCKPVTCGLPPTVAKGTFSPNKEYEYPEVVNYSCNTGFTLTGSKSINCSADGTFKPDPPTCTPVTCDPPPAVANGTFSPKKGVYEYSHSVNYSCQEGFKITGSKSIKCSPDGKFKPDPPTCAPVQCDDPKITNAERTHGSPPPHGYKATVTYKCRSGYEMIGEPTLTCDINSQWSPKLPQCKRSIKSTTTTTTTTTTVPPTGNGNAGPIVGGVLGGLAFLAVVVIGWFVFGKKREGDDKDENTTKPAEEVPLGAKQHDSNDAILLGVKSTETSLDSV